MANYFDLILQNPGLNHITIKIFQYMDIESLFQCVHVSPDWFQFIKENKIIWQQLHMACRFGNLDILRSFLKDPAININIQYKDGRTPLLLVLAHDHLEIVKALVYNPSIEFNKLITKMMVEFSFPRRRIKQKNKQQK